MLNHSAAALLLLPLSDVMFSFLPPLLLSFFPPLLYLHRAAACTDRRTVTQTGRQADTTNTPVATRMLAWPGWRGYYSKGQGMFWTGPYVRRVFSMCTFHARRTLVGNANRSSPLRPPRFLDERAPPPHVPTSSCLPRLSGFARTNTTHTHSQGLGGPPDPRFPTPVPFPLQTKIIRPASRQNTQLLFSVSLSYGPRATDVWERMRPHRGMGAAPLCALSTHSQSPAVVYCSQPPPPPTSPTQTHPHPSNPPFPKPQNSVGREVKWGVKKRRHISLVQLYDPFCLEQACQSNQTENRRGLV